MRKITTLVVLICAAVILTCAAGVQADAVSEQQKAQNKLLAERAARVDAMRKLAERIYGLMITSETSVRDFVAESDDINSQMKAFVRGARQVGDAKHFEDGTCQVTMQITLREVIVKLKKLYKEHYKGDKIKITDFEKITVTSSEKVIRETGSGAPRAELIEEPLAEITVDSLDSFTYLTGSAKTYWMAHCTGRGRLMAVRAARIDALRRLGERIKGLTITSETSVRDFVAEYDAIDTEMVAFIRGAREKGIRYHAGELIVEVQMQITMRELIVGLKKWYSEHYKGNKIKITDFEKITVKTTDKTIRETGMGVPPSKYLKNVSIEETLILKTAQKAPPWITRKLSQTGNAAVDTENRNAAQAKLMAYRGAELDARRKLAEKIDGLMITSNTSVHDFVALNDEIETSMLTFQQGGYVIEGTQKLLEDGTAQVTVEIELRPVWNVVLYYQKKFSLTIK